MVKNHVINCTFPKFPVVSYILGLYGKMKLTEWVTYWKRIRRKHIFYGNVIIIYAKKILKTQFWTIWSQKSSCWEKDKCRGALFPKKLIWTSRWVPWHNYNPGLPWSSNFLVPLTVLRRAWTREMSCVRQWLKMVAGTKTLVVLSALLALAAGYDKYAGH